jgi:Ferredoxin
LKVLYFSPTGNTKKTSIFISKSIRKKLGCASQFLQTVEAIDFTSINVRKSESHLRNISTFFSSEDIVIIGLPVYAGRIPNVLLKYLKQYVGSGAHLIIVLTYGNRHYDDAAKEAYQIFSNCGFDVFAVICVVGEHSFSNILAKDKPNQLDFIILEDVADLLVRCIKKNKEKNIVKSVSTTEEYIEQMDIFTDQILIKNIEGLKTEVPLKPYFQPLDKNGYPFNFIGIKPITDQNCTACGLCASICPMGAIKNDAFDTVNGPCIKCCACVKRCPVNAKSFVDENFIKHRLELEEAYSENIRKTELYV